MTNAPEVTQKEVNVEGSNIEAIAEVNTEAARQQLTQIHKEHRKLINKIIKNFHGNLCFEESLGFILWSLICKQDTRYVFSQVSQT